MTFPILPPTSALPGAEYGLIFRPGVPSAVNAYATAAEIETRLATVGGLAIVYIDTSIAPAVMPAGVTWDFKGFGSIASGGTSAFAVMTVQDGAQIRGLYSLKDAQLTCQCGASALPSLDWDVWTLGPELILEGGTIYVDPVATIPPISVPAGILFTLEFARFAGVTMGAAVPVIALGAGSSLSFYSSTSVPLPAGAISGGATETIYYQVDAGGFPVPAWTVFTGSVTVTFTDVAPGVTYTPVAAGSWAGGAVPMPVQDALDRIAAAIAGAAIGVPIA